MAQKKFKAFIFFIFFVNLSIMAQKEIKTSIEIAASPQVIWEILSDFSAYDDWNPFLKSVKGEWEVGNKVEINAGGMAFKPTVLAYEENKEIRWKGKLLFTGLFDGEHIFQIESIGDNRSLFKQEEKFSGILVGMFAKKLDNETKSGFEQMNEKLKELAEQKTAELQRTAVTR